MMKIFKRLREYLKRRDGFTLMELIVVIVIIGIVGAGLAALLVPSINIYAQSMSLSQGKLIAQGLTDQIAGELTYATSVTSLTDSSVTYMNPKYGVATISGRTDGSDGVAVLLGSSTDIGFDGKYYMNKDTAVSFAWGDDAHEIILVTVTVTEGSDRLNEFTRPIRLINKVTAENRMQEFFAALLSLDDTLQYFKSGHGGIIDSTDPNSQMDINAKIQNALGPRFSEVFTSASWRIVEAGGGAFDVYWTDRVLSAADYNVRVPVTCFPGASVGEDGKLIFNEELTGTAPIGESGKGKNQYYFIIHGMFEPGNDGGG